MIRFEQPDFEIIRFEYEDIMNASGMIDVTGNTTDLNGEAGHLPQKNSIGGF